MPFPDGQFVIHHRGEYTDPNPSNKVLDDQYMSTEPGNSIIDYPYNPIENINQHWEFKNDRLYNKCSGLILTFKDLTPESTATQEEYDDSGEGQKFMYDNNTETIKLVARDGLVVGAWDQDVKIVTPDPNDQARRWYFSD